MIIFSATPLISSRRNPLVRKLKALSSREGRREFSLLLLEGTHLLQEALRTFSPPKEIIATTEWLQNHPEELKNIPPNTVIYQVTQSVLKACLSTVNPDGVAALLPLDALPKSNKEPSFVLVLDRLQDPGNVGTLFRTALAAQVDEVWMASGVDPLNQKSLRASAGAILKLPFKRFGFRDIEAVDELAEYLKNAVNRGMKVLGSLPRVSKNCEVVPYWEIDWTEPIALVLGNEGSGLHPRLEQSCTHWITLPHSSEVESLNVASAAVPFLLERRRATMTSDLQRDL